MNLPRWTQRLSPPGTPACSPWPCPWSGVCLIWIDLAGGREAAALLVGYSIHRIRLYWKGQPW
jgi:hypothetical protein